MELDLNYIEQQLQHRWEYSYKWGRRQNNEWDDFTKFIYTIDDWHTLIETIKQTVNKYHLDKRDLFQYAANRWYNYWSARAVEQIFALNPFVTPAKNPKDRLVDFSCHTINFDHKTSVFPKGFKQPIQYAKQHKKELIIWLYKNQSQQQRKHLKNRLFIIVYAKNGAHWQLKADLQWLKKIIHQYLQDFDTSNLVQLQLEKEKKTLADIIWACK